MCNEITVTEDTMATDLQVSLCSQLPLNEKHNSHVRNQRPSDDPNLLEEPSYIGERNRAKSFNVADLRL